VVTRLRARQPEFDSRQRQEGDFFFPTASRPTLGPTQFAIWFVTRVPSAEVKWPGREADHLHSSSAEVKNAWSYTSTPPYDFIA
jgi:hypothetical protein